MIGRPSGKAALLAATVAVVLVVVGAAVWVMESPAEARQRRLDQRRMEDLRAIASSLHLYWSRHDELPEDLDPVRQEYGLDDGLGDPVTGDAYGYRRLDDRHVELCATFATAEPPTGDGWRRRDDFWSHPAGDHCFKLTLDDDFVPWH